MNERKRGPFLLNTEYNSLWKTHYTAKKYHLPCEVTLCYLSGCHPTLVNACYNPSQTGQHSTCPQWRDRKQSSVDQCCSIFLLPRNPTQAWRSLTKPHALIHESSDVCDDKATRCLGLISL